MRKIKREPNGQGIFSPGQDLVIAGSIGKDGVTAAMEIKKEFLEQRFSQDFIRDAERKIKGAQKLKPEFLAALGATEWEYVGEGGVFAALWNISGAYGQGFAVELLKIPVEQEWIEVCELLDLNPYRLSSGDCVIAAADNGGDLVRELSARGIRSAVVGKIEKGIARRILGPGGEGFLERPQPDEIGRLAGL